MDELVSSSEIESLEDEVTRTNFGASEKGNEAIQYLLKEKEWFTDERAVFRAAIAYGAARKLEPTQGEKYKTKWNIGTLESEGSLRLIMVQGGFTKDPYLFVNSLGDAALKVMYEKAKIGYTLSDILFEE